MIKEYPIQLDLKKKLYDSRSITVVSGDKDSNKFMITILDGNETLDITGHTATIIYRNSKGDVYYQNCKIEDAKKGIISVVLALDIISVPGLIKAEIELFKGENRATSVMFHFLVRDSLINGKEIVPKNLLPNYKKDLAKINREVTDNQDRVTILEAITNKHTEGIRDNKKKVDSVQKQVNAVVAGSTETDPRLSQALVDTEGKQWDNFKELQDNWQDKIKKNEDDINKPETIPFSTNGRSVASYPDNTKGLFYPLVKGVKPIYQFVKNRNAYDGTNRWKGVNVDLSTVNEGLKLTYRSATTNYAQYYANDFNFKSGDKVFAYEKFKPLSDNLDEFVTLYVDTNNKRDYFGGSGSTSITAVPNEWNEAFGIVDTSKNYNNDSYFAVARPGTGLAQSGDSWIMGNFIVINMTANGIEDYTEEQMLEIVRGGYWEGLKTSTQSYDFESRGKNIIDIKKTIPKELKGYAYGVNNIDIEDTSIKFNTNNKPYQIYTGVLIPFIASPYTTYKISYNSNESIRVFVKPRVGNENESSISTTGGAFKTTKYINYWLVIDDNSIPQDITVSNLQIEKGLSSTSYEQHTCTKTGLSVPRPLIKIGDVEDIILSNGDLVYKNSKVMEYTDIPHTLSYTNNKHWRLTEDDYRILTGRSGNELHNIVKVVGYQMTSTNFDDPSIRGQFYIDSQSGTLRYVTDLATDNIDNLLPLYIYYQLAEPEIIHDGEQGYQAPSPLPAYQNGDLVVIPKHHKKYLVKNGTSITLDEEICDIDFARTEIDGEVIDLDCTLGEDGKTITIPQTTGLVDIKGTIPDKNCLYPIIEGNVPANLGTIVGNNTLSISDLMEQFNRHKKEQNLINLEMDYRFTIIENA